MSTRRWAVVTAVVGTVFIAGGAFWLSFTALADLASRSGIAVGQAWAWPLIVDGIIVVATVAVVALSGQRVAWYPWALLVGGAAVSVTANALHAVVAADADVPGVLAACVAAVPPVVLLAITHLTVVLTRTGGAGHFPPDDDGALRDAREPLPASRTTAVHRPQSKAEPPGAAPSTADQVADGPEIASQLDSESRRVQAQRWRVEGWSNKAIARQLGVHPSTVGRWFATKHLSDNPTRLVDTDDGDHSEKEMTS